MAEVSFVLPFAVAIVSLPYTLDLYTKSIKFDFAYQIFEDFSVGGSLRQFYENRFGTRARFLRWFCWRFLHFLIASCTEWLWFINSSFRLFRRWFGRCDLRNTHAGLSYRLLYDHYGSCLGLDSRLSNLIVHLRNLTSRCFDPVGRLLSFVLCASDGRFSPSPRTVCVCQTVSDWAYS